MPNLCMTNFFKFDILNIAGHCKYLGTFNWPSISSSLLWWLDFSSLLPESLFSSSLDRYELLQNQEKKHNFYYHVLCPTSAKLTHYPNIQASTIYSHWGRILGARYHRHVAPVSPVVLLPFAVYKMHDGTVFLSHIDQVPVCKQWLGALCQAYIQEHKHNSLDKWDTEKKKKICNNSYSLYIWFDFIDHGAAVFHWTMCSGSYVLDKATATNCITDWRKIGMSKHIESSSLPLKCNFTHMNASIRQLSLRLWDIRHKCRM